ncbi:MAG: FtsQ-type POTRA domain-containing protein [Clostridium sp.]|nr:FtsQ-type POTRA domain-containing protein [Clostridium sp.]
MKKKETKKRTDKRRTQNMTDMNLNDLGLEPPKIYRESQKRITRQPAEKNTKNLTRHQKRQKETAKRKKKNKLRKFLIWFLVAVVLLAVGVVLSLTVFFGIEEITVTGNERYSTEEVLAQCTIDTGENLFLADSKAAINMLEQNLPYIYTAEIHRKLPSTLEINITECEASYSISNKDKTYILLDDQFKVLETEAKKSAGITIKSAELNAAIAGQQIEFKNPDIGECLKKIADVIKENQFTEFTSIYSKNIADNYVVYDKRIKFKLGNCDNLESKLMQGLTACQQLDESSPNAKGIMTINGGKQIYFTEE